MIRELIEGVAIKELKPIADERGYVMEILRADDKIIERFGQTYITTCYPGVIKGWHYHKKQTDCFVCLKGMVKFVLYDDRKDSFTKGKINEFFSGEQDPVLIKVPPLVIHGFKSIGTEMAIVLNHPTFPYNPKKPDEYRLPYNSPDIPYDWAIKMR